MYMPVANAIRAQEDLREPTAQELAAYEDERPSRVLSGKVKTGLAAMGVALSLFALRNVFEPQPVLRYRMIFLAVVLPMTLLMYRPALAILARRKREDDSNGADASDNPTLPDWALAAVSLVVCIYPIVVFDDYISRTYAPTTNDLVAGVTLTILVLVATWRSIGPILPAFCVAFILYAYFGRLLPDSMLIGHRGYGVSRQISAFLMGTEGIYGIPLAVAATYIILFCIYGAVLEFSGAGKFFLDLSFAAFGKSRSAPGRTVTTAGFLLGTVSGSGTATAVTLGTVAWPVLKKAGYPREAGGGVLAAAGIGAILSPPTLGAAAFIIAELLNVSYLQVSSLCSCPYVAVLPGHHNRD